MVLNAQGNTSPRSSAHGARATAGRVEVLAALRRAPFALSEADVDWVTATLQRMSPLQRLAQLFVLEHPSGATTAASAAAQEAGGYFFQGMDDLPSHLRATQGLIEHCAIRPLLCSDLEGGHYGSPLMTPAPNALGLAACDDLELSAAVAGAIAVEARALNLNWSFTPQVDLALNPRNPVVGTRSYGDDVQQVIRQARCHVATFREAGIATTAKHWPGDGVDERDQHLATSVNSLPEAEWRASYGHIYQELISAGVLAVMIGHIALPWHARAMGAQGHELGRPASLSSGLINALLRGELGFNGLVVSDASMMAGAGDWDRRDRVVPELVAQGCDIVLFSDDLDADIASLQAALRDGRLTAERVDEALLRILGMKAALGLHRDSPATVMADAQPDALARVRGHHDTMAAAARASITLVRDEARQLPLDLSRGRRMTVFIEAQRVHFPGLQLRHFEPLLAALAQAGFELRVHTAGQAMPAPSDTDVVLYLVGLEATPTLAHIGLDWVALHGDPMASMHRSWHDIPTVMVSFGNPFGLLDAGGVPTYLNAYSAGAAVQQAVADVLLGRHIASGRSPVNTRAAVCAFSITGDSGPRP